MKVLYIVAGTGNAFYCENCIRDGVLVEALQQAGHEVWMAPLYLPLFNRPTHTAHETPVFFGGINVCLQQQVALFRHTPRWLDRCWDARWLLKLAARRAASTRAYGLGAMTLSMLQGLEGRQAKELRRMLGWLQSSLRPDIVHLPNALLVGLAGPLRRALGCRVVCSLQGEDTWLDRLDAPYDRHCWEKVRAGLDDVDALVAVSRYYADAIAPRLGVARETLRLVPVGVPPSARPPAALDADPPVIGFLSRLSEGLGLGTLVDAFLQLRQEPDFARARLRLTGGMTPDDKPFLRALRRRLRAAGATQDVEVCAEFTPAARADFLASLSVLSVPRPDGSAFGTYLLEAAAAGVPVVQPRLGAFPEIVETTGGGVLYEPPTGAALADALRDLLRDPPRLRQLGARGRAGFEKHFTAAAMAAAMTKVYTECASRAKGH